MCYTTKYMDLFFFMFFSYLIIEILLLECMFVLRPSMSVQVILKRILVGDLDKHWGRAEKKF